MATAPKISNLPAAPNRQQPANFSAKGDALLSSLQGFATEANALGDYVEDAAGQVAIDKAAVDASVPLLNAAKAAAPQSLGYRDTAKGYKDAAEAAQAKTLQYKNDAASAVAYQNLASIAVSKGINMVDGCIDTATKPSLSVQQQTEWYWEPLGTATRGLRREMPQTLVCILDSGTLHLYDGDDPELSFWKKVGVGNVNNFLQDGYSQSSRCVSSAHGVVAVGLYQTSSQSDLGKYGGVVVFDFGADTSTKYRGNYQLSRKGRIKGIQVDGFKSLDTADVFNLRDGRVHSIKVAAFDNAPLNPISGVPEVTVLVGGLAGYHQLGWDGVKSDQRWHRYATIGSAFEDINHIDYSDGWVMVAADVGYNAPTGIAFFKPLTQNETGYTQVSGTNDAYTHTSIPRTVVSTTPILFASTFKDEAALGYAEGLKILHRDPTDRDKTGVTHITSKFNTGIQHGDNVMTIACDSVAEVVTQVDNFWENTGFSRDDGVFTSNGDGSYTANGGTGFLGFLTKLSGIPVGQVYEVTYTIESISQGRIFTPYDGAGANIQKQDQVGTFSNYFTGAGPGLYIYSEAFVGTVSNIRVRKAFADRVHSQKGIGFTGQVTKEKVASGADKVWFTGLTNNNRIIQSYNSDLDVGFGDFTVCGWFLRSDNNFQGIIQRSALKTGTGDPGFCIYSSSTNIFAKIGDETSISMPSEPRPTLITFTRLNGMAYLYADDTLWGVERSFAADMTVPDAVVALGGYWQSGTLISRENAKYADWRFSRTGMTQEHVSRMFREEAPLFRPNAKAVLNGTRNEVNFGDWDKKTGLLTVGNSSGRTVLSGIKPVKKANDPITSKIITHNGLVLEQ